MLADKTCLTHIGVPVHPKDVGWDRGHCSVQASQVRLYHTGKKHFFMELTYECVMLTQDKHKP